MAKSSFLPRRNKGYFGQKVTKTLFGNSPIMENTITYKERQGVHVPKDVKVYILKRVKEGGKTVKEIAAEHGIGATAIYHWLKNETGGASDPLVTKLQKKNQILKKKDKKLKTDIENVWVKHLGYGGERLAIELQINEKRIRRVMKKFGLRPPRGRKRPRKSRWNDNGRTYAIGVIPVKLVLAKAGNGNPGR